MLRQAALDASNAVVAEKRAELAALRGKVAALQHQLADTQAEMASLTFQARVCIGRFRAPAVGKRVGTRGRVHSHLQGRPVGLAPRLMHASGFCLLTSRAACHRRPT